MNIINPFRPLLNYFTERRKTREYVALEDLKARYHAFRIFLENNGIALELLATIDNQLIRGEAAEIRSLTENLLAVTGELVDGLNLLANDAHAPLYAFHGRMSERVLGVLDEFNVGPVGAFCIPLDEQLQDASQIAGRKAANLARMRRLSLPVPNGFVCTTVAGRRFLGMGKLAADIRRLLRSLEQGQIDLNRAANRIKSIVMDTPLPDDLAQALENAYSQLAATESGNNENGGPLAISVRSSGVAEDSLERSFAGQYTSILNVVGVQALFIAYKEVIASGFSARAISYRLNAGLSHLDCEIAVLCQVMAKVDCAGVLFTVDPSDHESGRMLISAVPGLGTLAVGGASPADLYRPLRAAITENSDSSENRCAIWLTDEQVELLMDGAQISNKTIREVPKEDGGVRLESVPDEEAASPLLSAETLSRLIHFGQLLENLWGMPQDIEWAYSQHSGLALLQARPLRLAAKGKRRRSVDKAERLLSGICASSGQITGCVRIVHSIKDLIELDKNNGEELADRPWILVLPQSVVDASNLLALCVGAIIDIGNPTDHLSCIARELGIPMLTGTENGTAKLKNGQWVILDADSCVVRAASASTGDTALKAYRERMKNEKTMGPFDRLTRLRASTISPEREQLRKMLIPLNLTDAYGSTFSLLECRSIHDIIRYTHEMAVLAMFDTGDMIMDYAGGLLRPLDIGVPFSFLVIDLGGGLRRHQESFLRKQLAMHKPLGQDDILSIPLMALCEGLTTPGLSWHSAPDAAAFSTVMSKAMVDTRGSRPAGSFNYALAARDYINLNARVEFHFAMLDAICGRDTHANYIRFRFKGGGAGLERGHRRALFLQHVLEQNGFYTTVIDDLITASLTGASKELVYRQLVMIGRLLGFSRFLDGVMSEDATPLRLAEAFLAGRFDTRELVNS